MGGGLDFHLPWATFHTCRGTFRKTLIVRFPLSWKTGFWSNFLCCWILDLWKPATRCWFSCAQKSFFVGCDDPNYASAKEHLVFLFFFKQMSKTAGSTWKRCHLYPLRLGMRKQNPASRSLPTPTLRGLRGTKTTLPQKWKRQNLCSALRPRVRTPSISEISTSTENSSGHTHTRNIWNRIFHHGFSCFCKCRVGRRDHVFRKEVYTDVFFDSRCTLRVNSALNFLETHKRKVWKFSLRFFMFRKGKSLNFSNWTLPWRDPWNIQSFCFDFRSMRL